MTPYNTRAIVSNIRQVFKNAEITKLNGPAYKFITLHMGFIAHYDLFGFQTTYTDLREFAKNLQTSELSFDPEYNMRWADEFEQRKQYEPAYHKSVAETIRGIIAVVREYEAQIKAEFDDKERTRDISTALALLAKHNVLVKFVKED